MEERDSFYLSLHYGRVVSCIPDWFISVNKPVDKGSSGFSMQRNRVLTHLSQELLEYRFPPLGVLALLSLQMFKRACMASKMVV